MIFRMHLFSLHGVAVPCFRCAWQPNIVQLADGRYRMYYTLIGPTPSNPDGCNNYTSATSSILSAISLDCGQTWTKETGVRLAPHKCGAELRVVSPEVVPLDKLGRHSV